MDIVVFFNEVLISLSYKRNKPYKFILLASLLIWFNNSCVGQGNLLGVHFGLNISNYKPLENQSLKTKSLKTITYGLNYEYEFKHKSLAFILGIKLRI